MFHKRVTRAVDISLSLMALAPLTLLFLPISLLLLLTGEGKVFYLQTRIGQYERKFKLIKFATMLQDSPNIGSGTLTLSDDPRVLPVGKYLRISKINELLSLLMFLWQYEYRWTEASSRKNFLSYPMHSRAVIASVKPGLTGLGSIVFSNEEHILQTVENPIEFYNVEIMAYKASLETWYVENESLAIYIKIIFATAVKLLFRYNMTQTLFPNLPSPPEALRKSLG